MEKDTQTSETSGQTTKPVDEPQESGTPQEPKVEEVDYKQKFSESTTENQRIMEETRLKEEKISLLEGQLGKVKALEEKGYSLDDIAYYVGNTQTQGGLEDAKLKREVADLKKTQNLQKEEFKLSNFLTGNKEAEPFRETLKALGRNNPSSSFKDLWEKHLMPAISSGRDAASKKLGIKKRTQVESGKGSGEETQELSLAQFKKLSSDKQAKYLKERGL